MSNVTKTDRWFGAGILAPVCSGGPVMAKTRLRQGTAVTFGGIVSPWSGVQHQA